MYFVLLISLHYGESLYSSCVFFLMIRRPPRSTLDRSSAASDVYKRQALYGSSSSGTAVEGDSTSSYGVSGFSESLVGVVGQSYGNMGVYLSLIHISEPTRPY